MTSLKHLQTGDPFPSLPDDGKIHFLSMRFCPYAQRIHLVLDAKNIPYNTTNINLKQKPEWLTKYSPLGKVPALGLPSEPGMPYIYESMIIVDYLDEKYPDVRLWPKDPIAKTLDRLWIEQFGNIISDYYKAVLTGPGGLPTPGSLTAIANGLDKFEGELKKRGTKFFTGTAPGMLDYMIWPWSERIACLKHLSGDNFEMGEERYPKLLKWISNMIDDPTVKKSYLSGDIHFKYLQGSKLGKPDYDMLLK